MMMIEQPSNALLDDESMTIEPLNALLDREYLAPEFCKSAGNEIVEYTALFWFVESIISGQSHPEIQRNPETLKQSLTNYLPHDRRSKENSNLVTPNLDYLASEVVPPQVCEGQSPTSTIHGQSSLGENMACIFIACYSASAHEGAVDQQMPPQLVNQHHNGTPGFDEATFVPSTEQSRLANLMILRNSQANTWQNHNESQQALGASYATDDINNTDHRTSPCHSMNMVRHSMTLFAVPKCRI